jgi:O-antigen/teichoic acid export membrane protein
MSGPRPESFGGGNTRGDQSADSPGVSDPETSKLHSELKRKTARGAVMSVVGQGATFALRIGSMVVLARLVTPEQFGLVGMVTAFTGLLNMVMFGLPNAAVQSATLSRELASTMFWLNLALGAALATLTALAAPLVAGFYGEPRLLWITVALAAIFIVNGAAAQHRALLQRRLHFGALVTIDIAALVASAAAGISMAMAGFGYWALVAMAIAPPVTAMLGAWIAARWLPGPPRAEIGIRSMLRYGGIFTINTLVVYVAYNVDKVLLGRFWGAEVLGVYGRAYQLSNIPTENLHSAMSFVMFPALARVQDDPKRLRNYFVKGYSVFLAVVMPITIACGLFAADIVRVLLGPQWNDAVPVFQLLAPTILVFALINPMGYMLQATGRASRSLAMAFVIAPVVFVGYVAGLPYGPTGVALGFSTAMLILLVPCVAWAKRGTLITGADLLRAAVPPLASTLVGAVAAIVVGLLLTDAGAVVRLFALTATLFGAHALTLLFGLGQKETYLDLLRAVRGDEARTGETGKV